MIFAEDTARWLLVLHTAVSVATVAALTHLVVWMRGYWRGDTGRHRAVRKFALIALALYSTNFVVGNVLYPTYRVRVRSEYLDAGPVVTDDSLRRGEEHVRASARNGVIVPPTHEAVAGRAAVDRAQDAVRAARWFDVKEHWVALGLAMTAALTLILCLWSPRDDVDSGGIAPLTFVMSLAAAGCVWLAAVIGVLTAAWRAV